MARVRKSTEKKEKCAMHKSREKSNSIRDTIGAVAACELAVEIGSENTRAYVKGQGCVLDEPSVVATVRGQGNAQVLYVGQEALRRLRQPANTGRVAVMPSWPKVDGFLGDDTAAEAILRHVFKKITVPKRLLLFVPHNGTKVEKHALHTAALAAGAGSVDMLPAAVGLAVADALKHSIHIPRVLVDIGAHTTETSVVTRSGIVYSKITRLGGRAMTKAIADHIKRTHNLLIDETLAEQIKIHVASAWSVAFERVICETPCIVNSPKIRERRLIVSGRDVVTGMAQNISVSSDEMSETIAPSSQVEKIMNAIIATMEEIPPELIPAALDNGILLTGGGSRLHGMKQRVQAERVPVSLQPNVLPKLFRK